jgi:hypothetical protein
MQQNANQITLEQALNILSQVASVYKGTLQEHQTIIEAFKVLKENIKEAPTKTEVSVN